ncbi:hypothetical protein NHP190012_00340 [Helicobacter sp. NHP19-012]|uniref:Methyl-accepting chemotaxis protein n=1 Tax=Helicobacter gastrofelis TaxID=2849642 RepID=A0ABN6I472_9HELI|nr:MULTISPECIES: hypothetical protein [unclassified Helicobacter]BCZ18392.1 hypothetical protein NHP190012_00340 [Helicobacter sp. NHP19-012]GMB95674.1 hypothetical protein NHP22001_02630 [Helicobacter sp. NHP22-001]
MLKSIKAKMTARILIAASLVVGMVYYCLRIGHERLTTAQSVALIEVISQALMNMAKEVIKDSQGIQGAHATLSPLKKRSIFLARNI